MIAQMIVNNKDNLLAERNVSIRDYLLNPCNKPKDEVPLWLFVSLFKDSPRRRSMLNYEAICAIIIEWDNKTSIDMTIEQFMDKYKHLAYALHTTSSHTKDRPKFRVILPLDMEYPYTAFKDRFVKEAMLEYFPGIDASCFSNFQKIPALPANPDDYFCAMQGGAKFGLAMVQERIAELELCDRLDQELKASMRASRPQLDTVNYEAYKAKVDESMESMIASLPSRENGNRYTSFCSAIGRMLNAKYPDGNWVYDAEEVKSSIKSAYWDNAIESAWRSFSRSRR